MKDNDDNCHCCLWCALLQIQRHVVTAYLDELLGVRTT